MRNSRAKPLVIVLIAGGSWLQRVLGATSPVGLARSPASGTGSIPPVLPRTNC